MKKKLLIILVTIFAVIAFLIAQYHIRQYYGIDPRIWFFVVFGISFVGLIAISEFISEIYKKVKPLTSKIKLIIAKIEDSFIYNLLSVIAIITAFTGIMYKLFFYDDFISRTALYIVFLVMIALSALSYLTRAIVVEKEKRTKELVYSGIWGYLFLMNFLEFVCI